jgi:hypothetical protein
MKPDWVVQPTATTLKRYGLEVLDWEAIGDWQAWKCPCGRQPGKGKFNIDHEHVRGWKNMKPAERKQYVRGLVCWTCNFFQLAKNATAERLRLLADYLDEYDRRRDEAAAEV